MVLLQVVALWQMHSTELLNSKQLLHSLKKVPVVAVAVWYMQHDSVKRKTKMMAPLCKNQSHLIYGEDDMAVGTAVGTAVGMAVGAVAGDTVVVGMAGDGMVAGAVAGDTVVGAAVFSNAFAAYSFVGME
eukprot:m.115961 g.115961  ORF g.115961 m.115961 type:complete len:130 (-) comp9297_c0_seq2:138-527(-)